MISDENNFQIAVGNWALTGGNISVPFAEIRPRAITPELILYAITGIMRMVMVPIFSILLTPYLDNHLSHSESAIYITYLRIFGSIAPVRLL